ncbi:GTP-binding proten HflX [Chondrus crispus]|uniref:GTP-binding proten HflX n=1 Tax=Chondrus crispus TaxID=2769 RepID=R7Q933_CHOCR|nr:GTP-binding proten HflX [Chondrus crispus]CDF35017.1 GTP-binding proten HflX [Chondrus crispus]|eukprot:XP_005714836.1 GTP-binding proten HflX [Chondrus crispus]
MLVGVDITRRSKAKADGRIFGIHESLDELARLAETAGMRVVGVITQSLQAPMSSTYIGTGKVQEVRREMEAEDCCTCIFDVELSPAQQRTLETEFGGEAKGIKVLDRTALILDIFAQHAATKEGQLQVELALYQYRLPRLTRMWTHLERQSGAGGVGLRGPGETQLEVDRRLINTRMSKLKRDLELVRGHRSRQRLARKMNVGLPVVALIGYTNAGKSTLLNALTGSNALAANALFATLDPTTRRASLEGLKLSPEILLTDTVGFVQNLPTQLVAAFRATLEEVVDADVLVHVVDASLDREVMQWQMTAVDQVLDQIGASGKPTVIVLNKADLVSEEEAGELFREIEERCGLNCVAVSAATGKGLEEVGVLVDEVLREISLSVEAVIPYSRGDLTSAVYSQGSIDAEDFVEEGTHIMARVPPSLCNKLRPYFVTSTIADGNKVEGLDTGDQIIEAVGATDEERWSDLAKKRHQPRAESQE